ncbi:hypothetical protein MKX01_009790 [Papaver californicum]|nr:hypothetical protein MKX01_009790 [Papaver californicum]
MGTLSFFPPSLSSQLRNHESQLLLKTQLSNPLKFPKIPIVKPSLLTKSYNTSVIVHNNQNDSQFVDENGVVEDMDGYMNHLSLEYDSYQRLVVAGSYCSVIISAVVAYSSMILDRRKKVNSGLEDTFGNYKSQ